jgi:hypothetical protein
VYVNVTVIWIYGVPIIDQDSEPRFTMQLRVRNEISRIRRMGNSRELFRNFL